MKNQLRVSFHRKVIWDVRCTICNKSIMNKKAQYFWRTDDPEDDKWACNRKKCQVTLTLQLL